MIVEEALTKKYLELYANCIPEKGICRAVIFDLQKKIFYFIPLSLYKFLKEARNKSINAILDRHTKNERKILQEYINFIISNNLGHLSDQNAKIHLPPLPVFFDSPSQITNAIYDYSIINKQYLNTFLLDLVELRCLNVQIRFFEEIDSSTVEHVEEVIATYSNVIFELIVICNERFDFSYWKKVLYKYSNIVTVTVFNVTKDATNIIDRTNKKTLFIRHETSVNKHNCGQVTSEYFAINIHHYTESILYNTCLNRKLSVDKNGFLCNCPSMSKKFGHISQANLKDCIEEQEFKDMWGISKSHIQTCNICEFKRVCTDCRAYLLDPTNLNSKPLKCGYDPYTGIWSEWSTNPISKQAVDFYKQNQVEE